MKRAVIMISVAGIALGAAAAPSNKEEWNFVKQTNGITIYSRPHPGSRLKEFKAIGEVDASAKAVHNVIDDLEAYPSFMPYTKECRVIERRHNSILAYQRLSPKIVADRDYTIRIEKKTWQTENGFAYLSEWRSANEHGPGKKPGVFRVTLCSGSWLLEPVGATKTRAAYSVFTDSGVAVPAFVANSVSETGISKLFAAVRKQAKEPKYRAK